MIIPLLFSDTVAILAQGRHPSQSWGVLRVFLFPALERFLFRTERQRNTMTLGHCIACFGR